MSPTKEPKASSAFTAEERAAMKEHAREQKARLAGADDAAEVLAKIAELEESDRILAERLHALILASVPSLAPRLWYGMPAYTRDGKIVCFFQSAAKFKSRYATLGFSDQAHLDDGEMWPSSYALMKLTPAVEARIAALVKQAAG